MNPLWLIVLFLVSCGGGISSLWNGSGEIGEGRFFTMQLDIRDVKKGWAKMSFQGGEEFSLPVCFLKEIGEGKIEFQLDVDSRPSSCESMKTPIRFNGEMGEDVITGKVLDEEARQIGVFRAFRVKD